MDWPVVLLGGCSGKIKGGQYLQYPSYKNAGHKTLGNLYLSLLSAGGIEGREPFGQIDPSLKDLDLKGPLQELLA